MIGFKENTLKLLVSLKQCIKGERDQSVFTILNSMQNIMYLWINLTKEGERHILRKCQHIYKIY